jgi:PIN domain nuclease of toxin-antitoxin system
MGITRITVDTHTLVWFLDKTPKAKRLSAKALEVIRESEKYGVIYVSAISLMEIVDLSEKGRISVSFQSVLSLIDTNEAYKVIPVNNELVKVAIPLQCLEIHDRLIMATALITDSVLLSKDKEIRATGLNVIWSRNPDESIK